MVTEMEQVPSVGACASSYNRKISSNARRGHLKVTLKCANRLGFLVFSYKGEAEASGRWSVATARTAEEKMDEPRSFLVLQCCYLLRDYEVVAHFEMPV